jgi:D-alanyl-D-alanine dipeptidase
MERRVPDIVLISDPRVLAIEVRECGEALVDLRGSLRVDHRRGDATGAFAHVRSGVAGRLLEAQRRLPAGIELLVIEAFRPAELQRRLFDGYAGELGRAHPEWTAAEVDRAASRWVAPVANAPHTAGAAVDLTLCSSDGDELDLGCPEAATPEESAGACYTDATNIGARARAHREILRAAMTGAGFVNYPTEWWHWSYGDRYWAFVRGRTTARYGPVHPHWTP